MVAKQERTYTELMAAWRTSCPKFSIWEEAIDRGLVQREKKNGDTVVDLTAKGYTFLKQF